MRSFPHLLISGRGFSWVTDALDGVYIILFVLSVNGFSTILGFYQVKRELSAPSRQIFTYP